MKAAKIDTRKKDMKDHPQAPNFSEILMECHWMQDNTSMSPVASSPDCLPVLKIDGHIVRTDSLTAVQHLAMELGMKFEIPDSPSQMVLPSVKKAINWHADNQNASAPENLASYLQKYGPAVSARLAEHLKATASDNCNIFNNISLGKDSNGQVTEVAVNHLDSNYHRIALSNDE